MFRLIELWNYNKSLKTIQEKAQRIDDKLQNHMRDNEQEFSKLPKSKDSADTIEMVVELQEKQIIGEIQSLEETFDQLTLQSEDQQLTSTTEEQRRSADISNTYIQDTVPVDYTRNKTLSEWFRGAQRGNFSRKTVDWAVIIPLIIRGAYIAIDIADKYADILARQFEEEKRETKKLLAKLRRKTKNYYNRFRRNHLKSFRDARRLSY